MGNQKCGGGLGPLGRLALVQVLLWFCKQGKRTQLGRTGRLCWEQGMARGCPEQQLSD